VSGRARSSRRNKKATPLVITVAYPPLSQRGDYRVDGLDTPLPVGTKVVTSDKGGLALGTVLRAPHRSHSPAPASSPKGGASRLLRVATEQDLRAQREAEQRQPQLLRQTLRHIREQELPLRLVHLSIDGIGGRASLCVLAGEEQDTGPLAATLGRTLGMKVELRRLGNRDEAKVLGGVGRCGRPQCCSAHLDRYPRVSIKMAKAQGVSLSKDKTTGNCSRTLCCLNYENSFYEAYHQFLPRISKRATTVTGLQGRVVAIDVLRQTFTLRDEDGGRHQLPAQAWDRNVGRELPEPELDQGTLAQGYGSDKLPVLAPGSGDPQHRADAAPNASQDPQAVAGPKAPTRRSGRHRSRRRKRSRGGRKENS